MADEIIMGVDPGSRAAGYGIVRARGASLAMVDAGVIRLAGKPDFAARMMALYDRLDSVIASARPDVSAIEGIFYSTNARSSLLLGHARGVAILALAKNGLTVHEYTPTAVKQAVVGYGRAGKDQVQQMIRVLLNLRTPPPEDAADALAIAVCHAHSASLGRKIGLVNGGARRGRNAGRSGKP